MKKLILLFLLLSTHAFASYDSETLDFDQQQALYNQEEIMSKQRQQIAIEQQNQEDLEMLQAMQANRQGY